tara:strand:- start:490 stop:1260 length:771 start_codon:yes stop_codon:yes gene_type:complete
MKKFSDFGDVIDVEAPINVMQENPYEDKVEAPIEPDTKEEVENPPEIKTVNTQPMPDHLINDPQSVGYPDLQTQEDIYRNAVFGILSSEPDIILDVGCGRGDFGHYIRTVVNPDIVYRGIDTNDIMIEAGRQKYSEVLASNEIENFNLETKLFDVNEVDDTIYDWIFHVTNMTVNYGYTVPFNQYDYLEQIIDKTIQQSNKGSVFVLLNDHNATESYLHYNIGSVAKMLHERGVKFAIDNSDFPNMFKLIIFNNPF